MIEIEKELLSLGGKEATIDMWEKAGKATARV
jgi:hypothetical protein